MHLALTNGLVIYTLSGTGQNAALFIIAYYRLLLITMPVL